MQRRATLLLIAISMIVLVVACTEDDDGPLDVTGGLGGDETNPTFDFGEEGTALLTYRAEISSLNDSGATGFAVVDATENEVTVTIEVMGVPDDVPHAQHLHIGADSTCPTAGTAHAGDLVSVDDIQDAAGVAMVSLTTEGDVGPESAVDLARYPVPFEDAVGYSRSFELPAPVIAEDLSNAVIVLHGMPGLTGDEESYDGEERSPMDSDVPLEVTVPIACGEFDAVIDDE